MTQGKLLAEIFKLIVESKVCPETKPSEWFPRLLYLHNKGWLYASGDDKAGIVDAVAAAYRIPEFSAESVDKFPTEEKGDILYVPFYAARGKKSVFTPLRMLKSYLKQNKGTIKQVCFYRLEDPENPRRYSVKGEKLDEQAKVA